jgi:hypothetical protein
MNEKKIIRRKVRNFKKGKKRKMRKRERYCRKKDTAEEVIKKKEKT